MSFYLIFLNLFVDPLVERQWRQLSREELKEFRVGKNKREKGSGKEEKGCSYIRKLAKSHTTVAH